jgi:hypothetical protein
VEVGGSKRCRCSGSGRMRRRRGGPPCGGVTTPFNDDI